MRTPIYLGADIECRSSAAHDTPLLMAAFYGHYELLKLLLGKGAAINAVSTSGKFISIFTV